MPSRKDDERTPRTGDRIAKLLARAGVASRREVERMIEEGRVALDGAVLTTPATVLPSLAGVTVDGQTVAAAEPARLFLYHKPVGLLVTERDPRGRPTIYDRLPRDLPRVVPVGRLDLATEGLLLLTTDGGLKRQLELPSSGVERTYRARAYGQVSQPQLEALIDGIEIDGIRYGQIDANLERRTGANVWIEMTLTEGKNREVRRVLEHLGLQVGRLIRTRYGPFILGDMPAGTVGEVRAADLAHFERQLDKRQKPDKLIAVTPSSPLPRASSARTDIAPASARPEPAEGRAPSATSRPQRPSTRSGRTGRSGQSARADQPSPTPDRREAAEGRVSRGNARPTRPSAGAGRTEERPRPSAKSPSRTLPVRAEPAEGGRRKPAAGTEPTAASRPARPQRKPGWARPKPKSGPGRPRK